MPQLPTPLHIALRDAVAARFGQPLRYPSHCDALETELQKASGVDSRRLSPSTLRRFFGLVEKEGGYHLYTLDTLARYAGHADFGAFGRTVAGLSTTAANGPTDIPELLAMERLTYPERLLLGYFLGRVTRPATPDGEAAPLALRLAAHPVGQEFFVESFVDLAHLNGAYGEVLQTYLRTKPAPEAQLFGHGVLFLGEFLAEDEAGWRSRLQQLLALPVPADVHAFPQGRRAFAEIMAAWHDAPTHRVPEALLVRLKLDAAKVPRPAPLPAPPVFYNLFPAGYHFFVAEALFLTSQFEALWEWLEFTATAFPELATLEHNVYNELLRVFQAVARLYVGPKSVPESSYRPQQLFRLETHEWLPDYYQAHFQLAELHLAAATDASAVCKLQSQLTEFAQCHRMPFFARISHRILQRSSD